MGVTMEEKIKKIVERLVLDLIDGNFSKLVESGEAGRLTAYEIQNVLNEYGGTLSIPPEEAYNDMEILLVENAHESTWVADFDLWVNNKRSDLTLSCTIIESENGELKIAIDDLHVL
jgi:hypothetical protein